MYAVELPTARDAGTFTLETYGCDHVNLTAGESATHAKSEVYHALLVKPCTCSTGLVRLDPVARSS